MTRAVLYPRVSSERQQKFGDSLETQLREMREYARAHDMEVVSEKPEVHRADELDERPVLYEIRRMMRRREFDVLVVHVWDRLDRDPTGRAVIRYEAKKYGVKIECVLQPIDDSPMGEALEMLWNIKAKLEHGDIARRAELGRKNRALKGLPLVSSRPPYGYKWLDETKTKLVPDPRTSEVVRRIFTELANGGTLHGVCRMFQREGVPTPAGATEWRTAAVRYIISNPAYWGEPVAYRWYWEKSSTPDIEGRSHTTRNPRVSSPDRTIALSTDNIPPLVSKELADRAHAAVESNRSFARKTPLNPEKFLLRGGFAKCGQCGQTATCRDRTDNGSKPTYRCTREGNEHVRFEIPTARVDAWVWGIVVGILKEPAVFDTEYARLRESFGDAVESKLAAITEEIAKHEKQRDDATWLVLQLGRDNPSARRAVGELEILGERLKELEASRQEAKTASVQWEEVVSYLENLKEFCREYAAKPELTYSEKRLALHLLGVRVTLWHAGHIPRYEMTVNPFGRDKTCFVPSDPDDFSCTRVDSGGNCSPSSSFGR